jgi:hypothetical protein
MKKMILVAAVITGVVFTAGTAAAPPKPDFSGTWVFNPSRSQLELKLALESGVFTIDHQEPRFRFSRVFVVGGKEDALSYDLTTDGQEKVEDGPGRTTTSRLYWDGDVLVLDERIVLKDGRQAANVVRYSLQDGGRTLVADETFRGPIRKYANHWVADRRI